MTVTYTGEVATCTGLGCFWKLLFRWKGSIYKLLWPNLIVYSTLYFGLSVTYRFLLDSDQRTLFEKMSLHCQVYGDLIPVSFILGFYVSVVIKRWWDQYLCLPWPDNLALFVSSLVHGQDERGRIMRRTIMRYVNLSLLITLRMISPRVKKRFPTLDHVVEAGWMLPGEKKIFEDLEQKTLHAKNPNPCYRTEMGNLHPPRVPCAALCHLGQNGNTHEQGSGLCLESPNASLHVAYLAPILRSAASCRLTVPAVFQPSTDQLIWPLMIKRYWLPLVWAGGIVTRARKEGKIKDDFAVKTLIDELNIFRGGCGGMLNYDWISIPLVYTQVVTLAVYVFFLSTLMGSQFLDPSKNYPNHQIDLIFPVFTFLQFFFYMGWLKVAESLVNPFGEDDDDFELNWLLDRNLQISYVIVDEMHQEHPEMLKDQYWDEVFPVELPYTAAAKQYQTGPPQYSAEEVEVPSHKAEFMPLDCVVEERLGDAESDIHIEDIEVQHPSVQRGETHPMKIKRRVPSSSATNSVSGQSSYSNKGKNSVLSLLSRIFHHNASSKEEVSKLGSSVSLNRRGNRSMSRVSVSHSVAPSRCSFVRESVPYNDYQVEVFSMSDLDITASIPVNIEDDRKRVLNFDLSQQSFSAAQNKEYKDSELSDQETQVIGETSPGVQKKELKSAANDDLNFERKEISPTHLFYNDLFKRKDSVARVIVQNNSPVYHVFTPVTSSAYLPPAKGACSRDNQTKTVVETDNADKESGNHADKSVKSGICLEGLVTILPPTESAHVPIPNSQIAETESSTEGTFFSRESQLGTVFRPSPTISFSYEEHYPSIKEPLQPPLYTCNTSSPTFTGSIKPQRFRDVLYDTMDSPMSSNVTLVSNHVSQPLIPRYEVNSGEMKNETPPLNMNVSKTNLEESEITVPEAPTPSIAIPVPALSQAHIVPTGDLELSRRPIVHELEPIIEHRDEGALSPESSVQETNVT